MTVTHYTTMMTFSRCGLNFKGQGQTFYENELFSWRHGIPVDS